MRKTKYPFILLLILASVFIFSAAQAQKTLAELYASGKIQIIPEIVIDDDSMGGDNFFESVIGITCDDTGRVYISDYKANNIKKFDSSGHFIKVIGKEGQGPGEFSWPWEIAVSNGRLIVWDMRNRRVCVLTTDGEFIGVVQVLGKTTFLSQRNVSFIDKCVWMQERDEDGLIKIVKYRISE